jgi:hypothetical protein
VAQSGKQVKWVRSDSAAYQAGIFNFLNGEKIVYGVTVDQDQAVKREIEQIGEDPWRPLKDVAGIKTGREVAEFIHSMNGTDHAFRVIVQRWPNPKRDMFEESAEYCYHGIATNATEEQMNSAQVIHWHNDRACSENYNKELKIGFNLEYMPCGEFEANAVWFGLGVLAYQLFILSKLYLLPEGWLKKSIRTVRWQLIQLAGKVVRHSRQVILRVCGISQALYDIYQNARKRCAALEAVF